MGTTIKILDLRLRLRDYDIRKHNIKIFNSQKTQMKKTFLFTAMMLILSSLLFSCKKDKAPTTAEKVQHKWTIVSEIDNSHDASGDDITTTTPAPGSGDFIEFNVNGTFTTQFDGDTSSGSYSITSDTQMAVNGISFTIKTLTNSQFVLYAKLGSDTEYEETTINLKR